MAEGLFELLEDTTLDALEDPTLDLLEDPTMDLEDPTLDLLEDPTLDPLEEPTLDLLEDPTLDPPEDPTLDPLEDPTLGGTLSLQTPRWRSMALCISLFEKCVRTLSVSSLRFNAVCPNGRDKPFSGSSLFPSPGHTPGNHTRDGFAPESCVASFDQGLVVASNALPIDSFRVATLGSFQKATGKTSSGAQIVCSLD